MAKRRITIKEIAKKAGVSIGTVDRVLHKRGEVAEKTKERVLQIASEGRYQTNVLARNLKLKRHFRVAVVLPDDNEYWNSQNEGIRTTAKEYSAMGLEADFYNFNRLEHGSFEDQIHEVIANPPDGVVVAPISETASELFCHSLDELKIPYLFVDSALEHARPLSFVGPDARQSGYLAAKLLNFGFEAPAHSAIVKVKGFDFLNKTISERIDGFKKFYKEANVDPDSIAEIEIEEEDVKQIDHIDLNSVEFLKVFVPNSRVGEVAAKLREFNAQKNWRIVGYDLIANNRKGLTDGIIDFVINHSPRLQGELAIRSFYKHFILEEVLEPEQFIALDIITRENLSFASY